MDLQFSIDGGMFGGQPLHSFVLGRSFNAMHSVHKIMVLLGFFLLSTSAAILGSTCKDGQVRLMDARASSIMAVCVSCKCFLLLVHI